MTGISILLIIAGCISVATIIPKEIKAGTRTSPLGLYDRILSRKATVTPENTSLDLYNRILSAAPKPAEAATPQELQRQFDIEAFSDLNEDPLADLGDTVKERMALSPGAKEAAEEKLDPAILSQLMDLPDAFDDPESITLDPDTRVFVDPDQFDEAIAKIPEEGRSITFKKAFNKHRAKGSQQFEWRGSLFTTRRKNEEDSRWASILRTNKAKANREAEKPVRGARKRPVMEPLLEFDPNGTGYDYETARAAGFKPDETGHWPSRDPSTGLLLKGRGHPTWSKTVKGEKDAGYEIYEKDGRYYSRPGKTFDAFMKRNNIGVKNNKVNLEAIDDKMGPVLDRLSPMFAEAGIVPEVTSGKREKGYWSLHETGNAIDLRLKNASPAALKKLKAALPGNGKAVSIREADGLHKGMLWAEAGWDYIIHGEGDNIHLHVERETSDAKKGLAENLTRRGLEKKIPERYQTMFSEAIQAIVAKRMA